MVGGGGVDLRLPIGVQPPTFLYNPVVGKELQTLASPPFASLRKFFIGTHKGVVRSHTLSNGVLVCDFGSTFKNEVCLCVHACACHRLFSSCLCSCCGAPCLHLPTECVFLPMAPSKTDVLWIYRTDEIPVHKNFVKYPTF